MPFPGVGAQALAVETRLVVSGTNTNPWCTRSMYPLSGCQDRASSDTLTCVYNLEPRNVSKGCGFPEI